MNVCSMPGCQTTAGCVCSRVSRQTIHIGTPEPELVYAYKGQIEAMQAEISALKAKAEKLHIIAKNVSHALMSFTPGGSEYFTRVKVGEWEDYYADADVCQRRVRERITKAEDRARDQFRTAITGGKGSET